MMSKIRWSSARLRAVCHNALRRFRPSRLVRRRSGFRLLQSSRRRFGRARENWSCRSPGAARRQDAGFDELGPYSRLWVRSYCENPPAAARAAPEPSLSASNSLRSASDRPPAPKNETDWRKDRTSVPNRRIRPKDPRDNPQGLFAAQDENLNRTRCYP